SFSKLSPFADGYRILITMAVLLRNHRPLYFFSLIASALAAADLGYLAALAAGALPAWPRVVHAALLGGSLAVAVGLVVLGVVLNAVNGGFREMAALGRRPR